MDRKESIARHYLVTGVLGAYETAAVMHEEEKNGKYAPCFEDATVFFDKTQTTAVRSMCIRADGSASGRYSPRQVIPLRTCSLL